MVSCYTFQINFVIPQWQILQRIIVADQLAHAMNSLIMAGQKVQYFKVGHIPVIQTLWRRNLAPEGCVIGSKDL